MPKILSVSLFALVLIVTGCQPKSTDTTEVSLDTTDVELSSTAGMEQPLEAQFMSKNGSFSYALAYDAALMTLVESEDMASPYFEVTGGSTLILTTDWVATVADEAERVGAPVRVGAYDVYQFMDSEGTCSLNVTLVPYLQEVLRLELRVCEHTDGDAGREALAQLLDHLVITGK